MTIEEQEITGRYRIIAQLGEGGMATVFRAYDSHMERDVAVKIIRRDVFSPSVVERVFQRFEREAKVLARLSHPNIVKILGYGTHDSAPFLVMEYVTGGTLKKLLGKPVPSEEAARILTPMARALYYAHQEGIIHRDFKPSNILITSTGEPMLSDFGIAKILEIQDGGTLTGTGIGLGTPEYMAPEQGLGKEVDGRADIYALGIVFYEMITGRRPYQADTPMAVILKHVTDPLPRPKNFIPDLPNEAERLLIKALAKKPDDRYHTMEELADQLEKLSMARVSSIHPPKQKPLSGQPPIKLKAVVESPTIDDYFSQKKQPSQTLASNGLRTNKKKLVVGLLAGMFLLGVSLLGFAYRNVSGIGGGIDRAASITEVQNSVTLVNRAQTETATVTPIVTERSATLTQTGTFSPTLTSFRNITLTPSLLPSKTATVIFSTRTNTPSSISTLVAFTATVPARQTDYPAPPTSAPPTTVPPTAPRPTALPTAAPPTAVPPTAPPTAPPPTAPPTALPTAAPPTAAPPTAIPSTAVPPEPTAPPTEQPTPY